jgi:spermidine synthase
VRFAPYIAFFLSGASSLIFQSIWTRYLHHVFGSTSVAMSTVLSVFMAGLGLGAWLFGRYASRIRHPLMTYAVAEAGVAACGLLIPVLVQPDGWLGSLNAWMRATFGDGSFGFAIGRFLAILPLLIVPTTLMGATLPLLSQHFVEAEQRAGATSSRVGALYAVNTFGAVAGTFLSGFVLMPLVGRTVTNLVACGMNLALAVAIFAFRRQLLGDALRPGEKIRLLPSKKEVVRAAASSVTGEVRARDGRLAWPTEIGTGALFVALGLSGLALAAALRAGTGAYVVAVAAFAFGAVRVGRGAWMHRRGTLLPDDPGEDPAEDDPIPPLARGLALVAFGVSGGAALCYEVVWTRALAMTGGSSVQNFTLILMTFLIGIAGGSATMSTLFEGGRRALRGVSFVAAVLAVFANGGAALGSRGDDLVPYALFTLATWAVIGALSWAAQQRFARTVALGGAPSRGEVSGWGAAIAMTPLAFSLLHLHHAGHFPKIVATVTAALSLYLAVSVALRRSHVMLIAILHLLIAASTFANYLWADEIPITFASLVAPLRDELPDRVGTVRFFMFLTNAMLILPSTFGMGAMFPLTLRVWTSGGRNVARDVGVVYTSNTIGSVMGAWLPGFLLFPLIGAERTLHLGIALNAVLALVMLVAVAGDVPESDATKASEKNGSDEPRVSAGQGQSTRDAGTTRRERGKPAAARGGGAALPATVTRVGRTSDPPSAEAGMESGGRELPMWQAVTVYVLAPLIPAMLALGWFVTRGRGMPWSVNWNQSKMTLGVFRVSLADDVIDPERFAEADVVFYHDGLSTTVTVERWGRHYALKNNGKVDASNGEDMPTQIMVAGYPLLLHPKGPRDLDVAVIGFGSGVTVGSALQFPVRSVDVIELERAIPYASRFFADVNHLEYTLDRFPYVEMDRLRVIDDDGRNYLASTSRKYDVIMSEPSNPWITGVSDLFTTDHFRIAKRALRPGGIYCQWVQLYELSPRNIKSIYRTFASQFRYVLVFAAEDLSSDTVMLGSDAPISLDLSVVGRAYELPGVAAELERAYIHSPYDVLSRVLLASRDEVMRYTQLREQREGGTVRLVFDTSNGPEEPCEEPECRLIPAPLNTDDNALIEFSAPDDLIGFARYEGYLANIYGESWPYGRLSRVAVGYGTGDEAARRYAEQAMSLVASGRKGEAWRFLERSREAGKARETLVASETLALLSGESREPRIRVEPPVPGPQMDRRTAERLTSGFDAVREAVDRGDFAAALQAMENIPAPIRLHSGPSLRYLYGYLLYKGADNDHSQYRAAIEQFEELARSDDEYVAAHPELYYFLARAHDAEFNFDKSLRNMRIYVESRVVPFETMGVQPEADSSGENGAGTSIEDTRPAEPSGGTSARRGAPATTDRPGVGVLEVQHPPR